MTPVIPCSVSFVPGTSFTTRRNRCFTKYNYSGHATTHSLSSHRFLISLPRTIGVFPQLNISKIPRLSATGTDVATVEEQDSLVTDEASPEPSKVTETNGPTQTRRRQGRKSEMPPVKNEDLVPGATFTGKVRSIQPFGAFVDFGAFTDGLVHVSRLSDSFVKDVNDVVSLGQEVKVRLVEVNNETGRISLSMRDSDGSNKPQQKKDGDKPRSPRRNASKPGQKTSKFVKGQDLVGTVKNLARSGAFISLPEGEEGFLPRSEEADEGFGNIMGNSSLEVGQEVNVRVLRLTRGTVTLTMKKEEDAEKLDSQLKKGVGVVHTATNPFTIAFRRNKDIAAFLDEKEKMEEGISAETSSSDDSEESIDLASSTPEKEEVTEESGVVDNGEVTATSEVDSGVAEDEVTATSEADSGVAEDEITATSEVDSGVAEDEVTATSEVDSGVTEDEVTATSEVDSGVVENEVTATSEVDSGVAEDEVPATSEVDSGVAEDEVTATSEVNSGVAEDEVPATSEVDSGVAEDEVTATSELDSGVAEDEAPATSEVDSGVAEDEVTATSEVDSGVAEDEVTATDTASVSQELVSETQTEGDTAKEEVPGEAQAEASTPEGNGSVDGSSGELDESSPQGSVSNKAISPALVKQLREETGAGMMDCKKALSETGGDIAKAQEYLRKKGLSSADKKSSRTTAEGRIGSYIHDSRIGVLIEVNCETDFVSRGDIFRELVDDLAMQVAACPQVEYLSTDDVPKEYVDKETEIEMQKEDLSSKPEQIRSKIVDGRVGKRLGELALLEQPFIKNDKVVVKDWVKQTIATIGENIKVRRFVKYNLGEGLEKKNQDFAAEVAAQTAAKPASEPQKEQPAAVEVDKPVEKAPALAISATLVKQLREETGAGMMDCKKALSETGGDIEKAQEYLRKKGLSAADKKSTRLAAEGRIGSYIHDARIGVLIEVNCETDFVGRSENFKELVDDLAMQVAACPLVQYVSIEDIPEGIVSKEKAIEMQREDILSKPENIREKIVQGRINKRLGELALMEQPFIKNDSILVKDLVKQTVAALGENIKVRRFARFTLGEVSENSNTEPET